jgi:hypothetical protein
MMSRNGIHCGTKELAEQLVALEAGSKSISTAATCRVCEKLRGPLVKWMGPAGFSSLLSRALALARRECPALGAVQVKPDGSLEGLESAAAQAHPILVGYLLSTLITFIGVTLTMWLLHDIWPDQPGLDLNSPGEESK